MSSISFDHQRFHNSLLLFFWVLGSASFNWYSHSSNFLRSIFSFSFRYKLLYHDRCLCSACSVLIVIFELHPFWQFHFFHVSELWSIPLFGCLSFAWGYSWHLLAVAGLWVVFLSIVNRMWSWWCFSISVQSFLGKVWGYYVMRQFFHWLLLNCRLSVERNPGNRMLGRREIVNGKVYASCR